MSISMVTFKGHLLSRTKVHERKDIWLADCEKEHWWKEKYYVGVLYANIFVVNLIESFCIFL